MDTRFEIPPRLRLNRQAHSFAATVDDSNVHATHNYDCDTSEDGDDDGSTPRIGMSVDSLDERLHFSAQAQAQSTPAPGREAVVTTPAERLRAVLSRAGSATPTARPQVVVAPERTPSTSASLLESDVESDDFETPRNGGNGVLVTPFPQSSSTASLAQSAARDSLRSLFSYAMRSPGNTPQRPRRTRSGSMDSSIAEESPIKWSMLRAGERVKRLSLSDDEKERIKVSRSGFADGLSEKSFKSSQAAAYDQLRERLESSTAGASTSKNASVAKSDMTIDMEEATEVEQELLDDRNALIRSTTPPVPASNTLGQSASQFPSQFLGSNLLTENSDMRRMIHEAQSETTDAEAPESNHGDGRTPVAGPSSIRVKARPSFVRERTLSGNGSVGSLSPSSTSSRPTSRQSMNEPEDQDRKRELERGWNHPLGPYMERHRASSPSFSLIHSGGFARVRKTSLSSISGSESIDGRASPAFSVKRQDQVDTLSHGQSSSKYASLSSARLSSSSPNQIRVSARTRTVSQPTKPSSPRNVGSSVSSNGTQKPLNRSRTASLTARDISRPPSSNAHAHTSPRHNHNGIRDAEHSRRSISPSSSRSSSRASSHPSEGSGTHIAPHVRERNWSSPRPKWNEAETSSLSTKNRRSNDAMHIGTSPTIHAHRATAAHATGSSPSSIPRLSVNGHTQSAKQRRIGKESGNNHQISREPSTASSPATTPPENGKHTFSSKDKDAKRGQSTTAVRNHIFTNGRGSPSPAISSKLDQQARSRHERDHGPPHAISPTSLPESNGAEPEEHDTPKIGSQRMLDSPTPASGSRPSSRVGTSSGFSLHNAISADDRANAYATASASIPEKARRDRDGEQGRKTQPYRSSVPSEPLDLHESDLDSFQEEDIVASSSAPRVHNGNDSFGENYVSSQSEELQADVNVLGLQKGIRRNGLTVDAVANKSTLLPANFSPPLSPPDLPSDPVTTTPQRRVSANSSKGEFKSPSTPKDIPALPDPPSSDEDAKGDRTPPVPVNRSRFVDVRTPRPPGAWSTPFATPAPAAVARVSTLRDETHPEEKHASLQNDVYTPPASYSRATSMVTKTPKPPGAWMPTPETIAAKRLQQKVRFDEQETAVAPAPVPGRDDSSLISDSPATDGSVAMKAAGRANPPSPRSPGRIRVVDAFGNEISSTKPEIRTENRAPQKAAELHATAKDEKSSFSDRRKSRIRVLDAMGREIDSPQVQSVTTLASTADEPGKQSKRADKVNVTALFHGLDGKKLEHKDALQLLQKTIAELKDDFNRTDDPASIQTSDEIDSQMADLKVQSIRAKEYREQLLGKIRDIQRGDPPSRSAALWNALLYGKSKAGLLHRSTSFKFFIALVFLQVVLFLAFYWLTALGARRLFLTTYIDPFYPELHLHITNPDLVQLSMSSPDMYASVSPSGWARIFLAARHVIMNCFSALRESVWDIWCDPPQGITWPPT